MTFSSCLSEADDQLVVDASAVINLLATGRGVGILEALRRPTVIPEPVLREIQDGERPDRQQVELLDAFIQGQIVDVVSLQGEALVMFAALVSGPASESLGDGEAATIALAVSRRASAVIDEKKATKLCDRSYPSLRLATTVDLLAHPDVEAALGRAPLATATLRALVTARMQVRENQYDWVSALTGPAGVSQSSSLTRLARMRADMAVRAAG